MIPMTPALLVSISIAWLKTGKPSSTGTRCNSWKRLKTPLRSSDQTFLVRMPTPCSDYNAEGQGDAAKRPLLQGTSNVCHTHPSRPSPALQPHRHQERQERDHARRDLHLTQRTQPSPQGDPSLGRRPQGA